MIAGPLWRAANNGLSGWHRDQAARDFLFAVLTFESLATQADAVARLIALRKALASR